MENDAESLKLVLRNLSLFIDKVHNNAYDPALVRREYRQLICRRVSNPLPDIGQCLTNVVRRTAELPPENFDPSPLLVIISVVTEKNPTQTRVCFT